MELDASAWDALPGLDAYYRRPYVEAAALLDRGRPFLLEPEGALFVRLPWATADKLDRAAEALGMRKKDLVASLVSKYVDPDSKRGLNALGALSSHRATVEGSDGAELSNQLDAVQA